MSFLFSDVGPREAPTRLRKGSHRVIARALLLRDEAGLSLRELSAAGYASSAECPETLATGAAVTVYLGHKFPVHAAQRHEGTEPRFMAQPALLPAGGFDPAKPPSPVQIAIRRACGLDV